MKENQLAYRFNAFRTPDVGDYISLSAAIRGMKYNKSEITKAFNKYVSKEDYAGSERDTLLVNLWKVSERGEPRNLPLYKATLKNEPA